jgi:arylformamidase
MRIIDISQPVGSRTAVWPGDQPYEAGWTMRRTSGDSVNVAALTMSAHTGTHIDGPFHFDDAGSRPADLDLDAFLGPALVIDAAGAASIDVEHVAGIDVARAARLLFRTRERVDSATFPKPFAAITSDLARMLGEAGVRLVGTDAPSVDPVDSKTLETHRILAANHVAILENLVLESVAPGKYTLIALPLRLVDADSSPVRAVLIEGSLQATK